MTTDNISSTPVELSDSSQWFGVLAGPVTWFVHFVAFYVIAEFGCTPGGDALYFSYASISAALIVLGLVSLIVPAAGGIVAYRNLRRIPQERISENMKLERGQYMSWLGLTSSIVFSIAIIVETLVVFFFTSCSSIMG